MTGKLVHIVDDEESIRKSTGLLLGANGYSVRPWASSREFLDWVDERSTGCVLLDIRMPEVDGLEVQREMRRHRIAMGVIVLTGHGDLQTAIAAMKAGASDFLEKPFHPDMLLAAIEETLARTSHLEEERERGLAAERKIASLSAREIDVLRGLADGMANKQIAYALGISPRTVEIHRANMMAKLRTRSLSGALRLAFAAGVGRRTADQAN
jgi:two-component system, LuxR family, response regulator FixJ